MSPRFCARHGCAHDTLPREGRPRQPSGCGARRASAAAAADWAGGKRASAPVCLGHTCDDQAETVLMRLARGSGVDGLSGIRSRAKRAGGVRGCARCWRVSPRGLARRAARGRKAGWTTRRTPTRASTGSGRAGAGGAGAAGLDADAGRDRARHVPRPCALARGTICGAPRCGWSGRCADRPRALCRGARRVQPRGLAAALCWVVSGGVPPTPRGAVARSTRCWPGAPSRCTGGLLQAGAGRLRVGREPAAVAGARRRAGRRPGTAAGGCPAPPRGFRSPRWGRGACPAARLARHGLPRRTLMAGPRSGAEIACWPRRWPADPAQLPTRGGPRRVLPFRRGCSIMRGLNLACRECYLSASQAAAAAAKRRFPWVTRATSPFGSSCSCSSWRFSTCSAAAVDEHVASISYSEFVQRVEQR